MNTTIQENTRRNSWFIFIFFVLILLFSIFKIPTFFLPDILRHDLIINLMGSLLAGILLTIILFALNEFIYAINLTGEWELIETIKKTSHNEYQGYRIHYTIHLLQNGNEINGYGEKIKQFENNDIPMFFEHEKRVRMSFSGRINKRYLSKTLIYLLICEKGRKRDSTSIIRIDKIDLKNFLLFGDFTSTAAAAEGTVLLKKKNLLF